jgi:plastocyanin
MRPHTSRRTFLRAGVALTGAVALTGCVGGDDGVDGGAGSTSIPAATVTVGPGGSLVFDPASLTVGPGTTIAWVWESSNHSVTPAKQPDGADWRGTARETRSTAAEHVHTFEVVGTYEYYCVPHRNAGMVGTLVVR